MATKKQNTTPPETTNGHVVRRWGGDQRVFEGGFLSVPQRFLSSYAQLKPEISSGEALLVLHLMSHKWGKEHPYPGYDKLAKLMGIKVKMVRLHAKRLQDKGYLMRRFRKGKTNEFDLTNLFSKLVEFKPTVQSKAAEPVRELTEEEIPF